MHVMKFQPLQLGRRPEPFSHQDWLFEILCDRPHKISSVAFGVMWRIELDSAKKTHGITAEAT